MTRLCLQIEDLTFARGLLSGSVKVSGRRGKKDSMKIDSISHLLDIHLDRGVINEGASARVRFEQTCNDSFVPTNRGSNFR